MNCVLVAAVVAQTYDIEDPEAFAEIVDTETATLTTHANINVWLEGPVWVPSDGGYLLFSAMGSQNRVKKLVPPFDLSDFLVPPANTLYNGHVLDNQERLISVQAGGAGLKVVRVSLEDKSVTTLASTSENGLKFYSPNDVIVRSDGTIWFTDPGFNGGVDSPPQPGFEAEYGVYRFHPADGDGTAVRVVDGLARPNGLCFSPDESILYVADWQNGLIRSYEIQPDGSAVLPRRQTFYLPAGGGNPDGIRCDMDGRIWSSGSGGVHIFRPDGGYIGKIGTGSGNVGNLCFGGTDYRTLYIVQQPRVMSIPLKVAGTPAIKRLDQSVANGKVNLSWPAPSTGFVLQETDGVGMNDQWTDSERVADVVDGQNKVEVDPSVDGDARYFRLKLE